jgi:branched-chain amino acid transport system substrate-binding protein
VGYSQQGAAQGVPTGAPKRTGTLVAAVGGGVLALLLVIAGVVWAVNRGGGGGPTDGPSKQAVPAVSPACGHKIAYLGMSSGTNSEDGAMMRNSVKMAIEDFNQKTPSCHVEFAEFDTQGTDDLSKSKAQVLADDAEVIGVVGPVYRNEILVAGPILDKAGIPWITPFSPDVDLAEKGWATFHRIIGSDADQAAAGGRYLKNVLKAKKTVLVYDDSDFGTVGRTEVSRVLGSSLSSNVSIRRADKDFTAAVKQVTDANPDAVYFAGQADDGAVFVKALRTAKPTMPIVGPDKLFTQGFVNNTAGVADGTVITCPCLPAERAGGDFASRYQAKYSETASYYGPEAYDAANALLAGFTAGKGTRSDMQAFLGTYTAKGISRSIKWDTNGNLKVDDPAIWAYKVANPYMKIDAAIAP